MRTKKYSNVKCKTCIYRAAEQADNGCDYFLITNQRRGCSVEKCDRYEKGEKLQLNTKMKAQITLGQLRTKKEVCANG